MSATARITSSFTRKTGRKIGYRRTGAARSPPATAPPQKHSDSKTPAEFRYIGKDMPITDLDEIVHWQGDLRDRRADARHGLCRSRTPAVMGSTLTNVDSSEATKVKGVQQVVSIPPAKPPVRLPTARRRGRDRRQHLGRAGRPQETEDAVERESARRLRFRVVQETLLDTVQKPGRVAREAGDVDAEFSKGGKTHEASYYTPMLAHAPMEPPAAVAEFKDGKVVTWAATQNPQAVQETVAAAVGIKKEDVICHVTLLGGGFGRKSKPDYVAEAAVLSKQVGKPVKIVWSREDDVHFDYFHSPAAMYLKAAVNDRGLADGMAAAQRVSADRDALQRRRAVRRIPTGHGLDRYPVSDPEPASGERPGGSACAHRLAALGLEYLSRFRCAVVHR